MRLKKYSSIAKENKRLAWNILYLCAVQGTNYILPLLTLPYLVRVLGVDYYGLLAFATAISAYPSIVADYGFNLSATRQISFHRNDKEKLADIYSSVIFIKCALLLICFLLMCIVILCSSRLKENWELYLIAYGVVIGQTMLPVWLFQGLESMKIITYLNIMSKTFFTLLVFVFVDKQTDYLLVPLFSGLGFAVSTVFAFFLVKKEFGIVFKMQPWCHLKDQFEDGWHVFLSRIYTSLYSSTNILVLGLVASNAVVGYYTVAEKIVQAISGIFSPVLQAYYPYLVSVHQKSIEGFYKTFRKLRMFLLGLSTMLTLLAIFFSSQILYFAAGDAWPNILATFCVLAVSIATSPFGPAYTDALMVIEETQLISQVVKRTMLLNLLIVVPLTYYLQGIGLAITWVLGQIFHVWLYYSAFKNVNREACACAG